MAIWQRMSVRRHPELGLVTRIWELRHQVTSSDADAADVALAEALD